MTQLRKDILFDDSAPPTRPGAVRSVPRVPARRKPSVWARLVAWTVEIPPVAYVALTGDVPAWARVWMIGWLSLWLIATALTAAKAGVES